VLKRSACSPIYNYTNTINHAISLWYTADLQAGRSGVRVPVGTRNFSLRHRVQTGTGARPASYTMVNRASFPGGNATGA
jgi:hypothetical protein